MHILEKFNCYCIRETANKSTESYPEKRLLYTTYNGVKSSMRSFQMWSTARYIDKTHYLMFSPKSRGSQENIEVKINNQSVFKVLECRFLCVIVDYNMQWKAHITHSSKKIEKSKGILSKLRKVLCKKTLVNMYFFFIYPYLIYCIIVWGNARESYLDPLHKITQK